MGELGHDLRLGVQPPPKSFVVTFDDGYEDGYTYAFPILAQNGFVATYFVIGSRIGDPGQLSVAEMQELVAAGNEIGNHTLSHRDLNPMTPEKIVTEIYTTEALIATAVGVWPESFCYPMGFTNAKVTGVVAATPGLVTAVVQTGSLPETWANRLSLPRIRVGPGSYPQYLVYKADRYIQ
jgi:peptidoglycan/xylan/chitin deacetylase (PgdA/CDA1 family)